jgi:thymidylate synthase
MMFYLYNSVRHIRDEFVLLFEGEDFVKDKSGANVIELIGSSFIADEDHIFGSVNHDYVKRELEWYNSASLNVNDIPGGAPAIWKQVADKDGFINSNYGWCIFSSENGNQYSRVLQELSANPTSRRAIMIYTRPEMWHDYNKNGRSDFMCTNTVQYVIRNNKVNAIVQMRSNDAWAGYRNDYAWQKWVLQQLTGSLNGLLEYDHYDVGDIVWQAGSLHIYERQFYLIEHFIETGVSDITKEDYDKLRKVE